MTVKECMMIGATNSQIVKLAETGELSQIHDAYDSAKANMEEKREAAYKVLNDAYDQTVEHEKQLYEQIKDKIYIQSTPDSEKGPDKENLFNYIGIYLSTHTEDAVEKI